MPFDDYYKNSDKEITRHWKSVGSTFALLAVVLISVNGLYAIYKDYKTESDKESARIKHADTLCTNLPKPVLFNFVKSEEPVIYNNNSATEIVYHYQTERDSKIIIPQFLQWFKTNGWKRDSEDELIFTKGRQRIAFESTDNFFTYYAISCYVEDLSFGIYD